MNRSASKPYKTQDTKMKTAGASKELRNNDLFNKKSYAMQWSNNKSVFVLWEWDTHAMIP